MKKGHTEAIFIIDRVFIGLFTMETIIRIFAEGVSGYRHYYLLL